MALKIAFIGDVAFYGRFDKSQNPSVEKYFESVKQVIDQCDYCIGNLETPLVDNADKAGFKSAYVSGATKNVELLTYIGINAVSLANNHMFDYGREGIEETINALENEGIEWFGVDSKDLLVKSMNLAIHGYCSYNTNPSGIRKKNEKLGIEPLEFDRVLCKFEKYSSLGYFNVLSVHSGLEHVNLCSVDDIKFARKLSNYSNYAYIGHHPHVLQGCEVYNNSLLAYSLGNFCFDDVIDEFSGENTVIQSENNKSSTIMIISLEDGEITDVDNVFIYQGKDRLEVNNTYAERVYEEAVEHLNLSEVDYVNLRRKLLGGIYSSRQSSRDIRWFLNRVNLNTVRRIIERRVNEYKYRTRFSSRL